MCFLLLQFQLRADYPVVLMANRDESYSRSFEAPTLRDPVHGIVAPRDLRAGGTWLGQNRHGVVAAITNRGADVALEVRSRGLLVTDALSAGSAHAAVAWLGRHLADNAYAGFNLLLADADGAFVVRHDAAALPRAPAPSDVVALAPGAHALSNLHDLDQVDVPAAGLPGPQGEPIDALLARLAGLAQDDTTRLPGDHRILKRGRGRGTVCSALLAVPSGSGTPVRFTFAAGVPGQVPFLPV